MIQGYRACAIKTSDDANHFILYTGSYKVVIQIIEDRGIERMPYKVAIQIIEDRGIERMPWKLAMMQIILYSIQGHIRWQYKS